MSTPAHKPSKINCNLSRPGAKRWKCVIVLGGAWCGQYPLKRLESGSVTNAMLGKKALYFKRPSIIEQRRIDQIILHLGFCTILTLIQLHILLARILPQTTLGCSTNKCVHGNSKGGGSFYHDMQPYAIAIIGNFRVLAVQSPYFIQSDWACVYITFTMKCDPFCTRQQYLILKYMMSISY